MQPVNSMSTPGADTFASSSTQDDSEPMFASMNEFGHPKAATKGAVVKTGGGIITRRSSPGAQRARHGEARVKIRPGAWIMQILVWALLILSIWAVIQKVKDNKRKAAEIDGFSIYDPQPTWKEFILSFGWIVIPALFLIMYSVHICCTLFSAKGTAAFLHNARDESEIKDFVQQMRLQPPDLQFTAECYHYEHHSSTDAQGNTTTRRVKRVTHRANQGYTFKEWEDRTAAVDGLDEVSMTKVHLSKELEFMTLAVEDAYEAGFREFCDKNRMDTHQEFHQDINIEGFKERLLCVSDSFRAPCMATASGYRVATILLMNVPYRIWFDMNTGIVRHSIVKRIG